MKIKYLVIIAAIFMIALATPALAVGSDYVSKYTLNNIPDGDGCGQLNIATLAQNNIFSKEIVIQRVSESNKSFVNGDLVQKEFINGFIKTGPNFTVKLLSDGKFDGRFAPGVFTAILLDGNGGKPEYAVFTIDTVSSETTITFIGHASSFNLVSNNIKIISATYGVPGSIADVTTYFQTHLIGNTVSPIITGGASHDFDWFNSFGVGDPAPGIVKQVSVTYMIGNSGPFTFATLPDVNAVSETIILN